MSPSNSPAETAATTSPLSADFLLERYRAVRGFTEELCEPLEPEDCVIQSMPDASPTRWHLAHTTWFFEKFVLARVEGLHEPFHPGYDLLFNSYYNSVGEQFPRPERGVLSRPTVKEVFAYRRHVDERVEGLLDRADRGDESDLLAVIEVGLHHEQQHQELLLTDIKHVLSRNPLRPIYRAASADAGVGLSRSAPPRRWLPRDEGLHWVGHEGDGFAYDNEEPRHRRFVERHELASRLVTNAEYVEFIEDDGYRRPELWLADGWQAVSENGWAAPLYWEERDGERWQFTLSGLRSLSPVEPVCHVSFYEADAFARWAAARLPTEVEWELAAREVSPGGGNLVETGLLHPRAATDAREGADGVEQLFGDVWEWTASPYISYPGYKPFEGSLGEYNGKFMCNQFVLRGGSCATSRTHIRDTYRNFFPPEARWQFSGLRLVR